MDKQNKMFSRIDVTNIPTDLKNDVMAILHKRGITLSQFVKQKMREFHEEEKAKNKRPPIPRL
jgi:hypothetical protein